MGRGIVFLGIFWKKNPYVLDYRYSHADVDVEVKTSSTNPFLLKTGSYQTKIDIT